MPASVAKAMVSSSQSSVLETVLSPPSLRNDSGLFSSSPLEVSESSWISLEILLVVKGEVTGIGVSGVAGDLLVSASAAKVFIIMTSLHPSLYFYLFTSFLQFLLFLLPFFFLGFYSFLLISHPDAWRSVNNFTDVLSQSPVK